ncbi:uncharacterized protein LOC126968851 isoform X2 [Leptidea sinapis]|uniref:uncharacterized protein LOC126968851 isoform X2 n=1 Tax=Leptidea sinapis TaxID=189913 RepID=UPI00212230DC|nr:uncharacterized protein LOC126968851 isoform X2 [Leptidea sinapis]
MEFKTHLDYLNKCFIHKLRKNYDETTDHQEFILRNKNLEHNFDNFVKLLYDISNDDLQQCNELLSSIVILEKELTCEGSWNNEMSQEIAKKLNHVFESKTKLPIDMVLRKNKVCKSEEVFDKCLENLHMKLTSEDFKKYPAQVEVYCSLILNLKNYNVSVIPSKLFPASILLIEDYLIDNKIKGLKCCLAILKLLKPEDFDGGNYYDVIYMTLKKNLNEKDIDVTKLNNSCMLALLELLPEKPKCLETWIEFNWPVWRLENDYKVLCALLKVLYICKDDELNQQMYKIIVTLICLCTIDEQKLIINQLNEAQEIQCNNFKDKIENIKAFLNS